MDPNAPPSAAGPRPRARGPGTGPAPAAGGTWGGGAIEAKDFGTYQNCFNMTGLGQELLMMLLLRIISAGKG